MSDLRERLCTMTGQPATQHEFVAETGGKEPWPALWALVIGFFMILIDTTIVSVANPAIMKRPRHRHQRGRSG